MLPKNLLHDADIRVAGASHGSRTGQPRAPIQSAEPPGPGAGDRGHYRRCRFRRSPAVFCGFLLVPRHEWPERRAPTIRRRRTQQLPNDGGRQRYGTRKGVKRATADHGADTAFSTAPSLIRLRVWSRACLASVESLSPTAQQAQIITHGNIQERNQDNDN